MPNRLLDCVVAALLKLPKLTYQTYQLPPFFVTDNSRLLWTALRLYPSSFCLRETQQNRRGLGKPKGSQRYEEKERLHVTLR